MTGGGVFLVWFFVIGGLVLAGYALSEGDVGLALVVLAMGVVGLWWVCRG